VERKHHHILNKTHSLLFQSNIPKAYWSYAVSQVVYLINRLLSTVLKGKTLHDLLYNIPPTYLDLKTFGCLCFASTLKGNRNKFSARAKKGVFLRYKSGVKGYIVLDIHTREIFVSRNVIFYENVFPYKNQSSVSGDSQDNFHCNDFLNEHVVVNTQDQIPYKCNNNDDQTESSTPTEDEEVSNNSESGQQNQNSEFAPIQN